MSILWHITTLLLLGSCTPGFVDGIVGGKVSIPHSRPYMVYIHNSKSKGLCSGFLVREDFVMTAAHSGKGHFMVYLGVNDTNFLPVGLAADSIPHEHFRENKPGHDIMLLKLKTPVNLTQTVKTIPLPKTRSENISEDCMVMGWGLEDYRHGPPSSVLKEANVTLLDSVNCGTPDTLCSKGTTGPAPGDAGGPLVCGNVAQGIMSYYLQESNGDYCTRYTQISQYLPWIRDKMDSYPLQKN